MNNYKFSAIFLSNIFNRELLNSVIPLAKTQFNNLSRQSEKKIDVSIDSTKNQLNFTLSSARDLTPNNYLRASQYFSKVLSTLPGMEAYIVNGRLLIQN